MGSSGNCVKIITINIFEATSKYRFFYCKYKSLNSLYGDMFCSAKQKQ